MALTDADLDRMSNWPVDSDVPALVAEIRRLRAAQITTLVACSRCGHGQRVRNMVALGDERLCVECAGVEIGRLWEWKAQVESGEYGVSVTGNHACVTLHAAAAPEEGKGEVGE